MTLFDDLLTETDQINRQRQFDKETGHLPGNYEDALPYYKSLLQNHHTAMLDADVETAMALRQDAYLLARKLNKGDLGILAHDEAPGYVLARETKAMNGEAPLWGQQARFEIEASGILIRIETDGIFGIGASHQFWPGFSAHCTDPSAPFITETGYRSFLGLHVEPCAGLTPDIFAQQVIATYIREELQGQLVVLSPRYRTGEAA